MGNLRRRMTVSAVIAALLTVLPLAAQTERDSGASSQGPVAASVQGPYQDFTRRGARLFLVRHAELLGPRHRIDPGYDREIRLALWNDPMGRLFYAMAAEDAMNGRTGLVNGGRSLGAGLALTALGSAVSPLPAFVEVFLPPPAATHNVSQEQAGDQRPEPPAAPSQSPPA